MFLGFSLQVVAHHHGDHCWLQIVGLWQTKGVYLVFLLQQLLSRHPWSRHVLGVCTPLLDNAGTGSEQWALWYLGSSETAGSFHLVPCDPYWGSPTHWAWQGCIYSSEAQERLNSVEPVALSRFASSSPGFAQNVLSVPFHVEKTLFLRGDRQRVRDPGVLEHVSVSDSDKTLRIHEFPSPIIVCAGTGNFRLYLFCSATKFRLCHRSQQDHSQVERGGFLISWAIFLPESRSARIGELLLCPPRRCSPLRV